MHAVARPSVRLACALAALLPLLVALAGCGYRTDRLDAFPMARSVAVFPFENTGFRRGIEDRLTQAVADEVRGHTHLALSSPASADLILTGALTANEQALVLREDTRDPLQKRLQGFVDVVVRDRRSGRELKRTRVVAYAEFRPGVDGESLEGSATSEFVRRLAQRIVQVLEPGI
jgi:hypothetical protein